MSRILRVASRGSRLALAQTQRVVDALTALHRDLETQVVTVTTRGDRDHRPFSQVGGKGLFSAEVERAVVNKEADIAVHSAKDLTAQLHGSCELICVPERLDPHDVVVGGTGDSGEERLANLPEGSQVGTSSVRRRALLAEARAGLECVDLRGNLDTRLRKVSAGDVEVAILAAAGLARLQAQVDVGDLDPSWWIPAPAQGALAIEALADRRDLAELFAPLQDEAARAEVLLERAFSEAMEGGCSVPLGCLARASKGDLVATGYLGLPDGSRSVRDRISGPPSAAEALGRELATALRAAGGDDILEELAETEVPEPSAP